MQYKCCKWRRRLSKNILTDAVIEFTKYKCHEGNEGHESY